MEETNEKPRRRSRYFLYQDGVNFAIGKQEVRYEPNVEKDVYGVNEVFLEHPVRRSIKNKFPLSLYPTVQDEPGMDPRKNITEDIEEGIMRMFVEANKAAGLLVKSTCSISSKEFDYKNMRILSEKDLTIVTDGNGYPDTMTLNGRVTKEYSFLRKGDIIKVGDVHREVEAGNNKKFKYFWRCRYDSKSNKFGLFERLFKKFFWKLFNKPLYQCRWEGKETMLVPLGMIYIDSGNPVEPETFSADED